MLRHRVDPDTGIIEIEIDVFGLDQLDEAREWLTR